MREEKYAKRIKALRIKQRSKLREAMRARKVDDNHTEIIRTLRKAGVSVSDTSAVGCGFPDTVCGHGGRTFLIEIKDGAKSPSRRKLTEAQVKFVKEWKGHYVILDSVEAAKEWIELNIIE